jgi:L-amino acid N-acyltransferase YncA
VHWDTAVTRERQAVVRSAGSEDAAQIAAIYNHYVLTSAITFEEEPVAPAEMASRIREVQASSLPWLVATHDDGIVGYAYGGKWRGRAAYRFAAEVSIYVREGLGHGGIGTALYSQLLPALKACGMHAVIGGFALPNDASLRLHQKFGFEQVAHLKEVGFKFDRWIDVTYWQVIL